MSDLPARRAWIKRVLGAAPAAQGRGTQSPPLLPIWRAAKDAADQQIGALQSALRDTETDLGRNIADKGIAGLTDGLQVRLIAALMDYDNGGDRAKSARRVREAVGRLRSHIDSEKIFDLLDDNPFDVAVSLRQGIGGALARIESSIPAAQGGAG